MMMHSTLFKSSLQQCWQLAAHSDNFATAPTYFATIIAGNTGTARAMKSLSLGERRVARCFNHRFRYDHHQWKRTQRM